HTPLSLPSYPTRVLPSPIHTPLSPPLLPSHTTIGQSPFLWKRPPVLFFPAPARALPLPCLSLSYLSFIILSGPRSHFFLPLPVLPTLPTSHCQISSSSFPFREKSDIFFSKFPFTLAFPSPAEWTAQG
uniref:Uncharacterized protein n=1 Tax=Rhinolophus ferrumequinum TaxID=59479 RepID=A0A671F673_RHIFE